jgi:hypothetical protein
MSLRLDGLNPLSYLGVTALQPPNLVVIERDPISGGNPSPDYRNFNICTFWLNPINLNLWYLASKENNFPIWVLLSSGGAAAIETITGNDGIPESPSGIPRNFNFLTTNTTAFFLGSAATETLNFGLTNLIIGTNPTATITTAVQNVGLGQGSLGVLTSGQANVSIGFFASGDITTGHANTGIGNISLRSLTTGFNNVAVGSSSLNNLITGSGNIAIGSPSGANYTTSESNNILLNSAGTTGESNVLRIGISTGAGTGMLQKAFIQGIQGVTVSNPVTVVINSATGQLGVAAGGGQPIETITGNTGGAQSPSAGNFNFLTTGATVKFAGTAATETLDFGASNMILGSAPAAITGAHNFGFGNGSLGALTGGNFNTAVGFDALTDITTGSYNTALGDGAGATYTVESSNICIANVGTVADANTIRIGTQGAGPLQIDQCFIAGIYGVTPSSTTQTVIINAAGQLGTSESGSGAIKVTPFTVSGTWFKDPATTEVEILCYNAGNGAGSGAQGGANAGGGGGGAAGGGFWIKMPSSKFGASETVIVGTGGTGGASVVANNTAGNDGTIGGQSSVGNMVPPLPTAGGHGGAVNAGGLANNSGPFLTLYNILVPSADNRSGIGGFGANPSTIGDFLGGYNGGLTSFWITASTGGGGGGIGNPGSDGGLYADWAGATILAGGAGGVGGVGGNGLQTTSGGFFTGATGGGGGAGGFAGGNGGPGAGGGGGGASANGSPSGAGGNGGNGLVIIYEYL